MAYANYDLPFTLHTDASGSGLGAVLYQHRDDKDRVIAFASRSLKPAEKHYPAYYQFLALKAITEKFHDYLYGATFEVVTDNNPLTYVTTTAKLDATGQRWMAALVNYNFTTRYRPGKNNADADSLSRLIIDPPTFQALSTSVAATVEALTVILSTVIPESISEVEAQGPLDGLSDKRLVVPPQMGNNLISQMHETIVGHQGIKRTEENIMCIIDEPSEVEEFTDWLGSFDSDDGPNTAFHKDQNQQVVVSKLTSAEPCDTVNPTPLFAKSEPEMREARKQLRRSETNTRVGTCLPAECSVHGDMVRNLLPGWHFVMRFLKLRGCLAY
ncbi:uncharacterized protein LOC127861754 [Dreissena polymorpha]|uniref:uncharacterized protein LOC127861754 n=1 Tax=Dreissena polymorpha TaxID=45954 RepID=UPI0022651471|nr:uncharacterized protein LOC127861754 [Dreissena polymorpha]